ncbi:MAG TPA: hypothetical protein VEL74_20535 [Thermoanaerobaculia bacterium]|nr:hypothetical protein [Thermoanaerobaculia bacterium]
MATIVVTKGDLNWGKGEGSVDSKAGTASITSWVDQAAMTVGTTYGLKTGGKSYTGKCQSSTLPINFTDVE